MLPSPRGDMVGLHRPPVACSQNFQMKIHAVARWMQGEVVGNLKENMLFVREVARGFVSEDTGVNFLQSFEIVWDDRILIQHPGEQRRRLFDGAGRRWQGRLELQEMLDAHSSLWSWLRGHLGCVRDGLRGRAHRHLGCFLGQGRLEVKTVGGSRELDRAFRELWLG